MSSDSTEDQRRATFKAAAKGLRAYTIALRLAEAKVTPGIDFRGCTKKHLEDDFAQSDGSLRHLTGQMLRDAIS